MKTVEEFKDPVYLITRDLTKGGVEKQTGYYEREALEVWVERATRENSEFILAWEIIEIEEKK